MSLKNTVAKLAKSAKTMTESEAQKVLKKYNTAEKAVATKGADRAEYLQALDVMHGPAPERAKAMGFGDKTWYHGTTVPIDEFKNEAKGLSTNAQSAKKGFFFAQDPSTASDYAALAKDKGIIRDGDTITTRWKIGAEDPAIELNKKIRDTGFERRATVNHIFKLKEDIASRQSVIESRLKALENGEWQKVGISKEEYLADIEALKAKNAQKNEYLKNSEAVFQKHDSELKTAQAKIEDVVNSGGQNVMPVKLRKGDGGIRAKDYEGARYRDVTYSDVMSRAQKDGQSGVLFKNTYDAADPTNRVRQNIAAVFEPNQIRSKFAAFDPRFKDSPLLMAGTAGAIAAGALAGGNEAEASPMDPKQLAKAIAEAKRAEQITERLGKKAIRTADVEPKKGERSMFEAAGRKALEVAAPVLSYAAPVLEKAAPALNVLGKPQELATAAASKITGGSGEETSFADIAQRLSEKLPTELQNPGAARDIGYALDLAFPAVPLTGPTGKALKAVDKELKAKKISQILEKRRKAMPDLEQFQRLRREAETTVPKLEKTAESVAQKAKAEEAMKTFAQKPRNYAEELKAQGAKVIEEPTAKPKLTTEQLAAMLKKIGR